MKILVLNSGSSSLKFQLFSLPGLDSVASGLIENIGREHGDVRITWTRKDGTREGIRRDMKIRDHKGAVQAMSDLLGETGTLKGIDELSGIGHRVVHGGEYFKEPVLIDETVIDAIRELIPLAPLHNPANLTGIQVAVEHAPGIPQVAGFDTAFHQSIPEHAYLYALPYRIYEEFWVRRYGFHGTSHCYVSKKAAEFLCRGIRGLDIITLHLGNGASAAAVKAGRSIDTSMGFTPLEGLIMGTRSGDLDPAILFYLAREHGMEIRELDDMLNRQSGLKGICGENDMRTITEMAHQGDRLARLALDMFCYRVKKYIGAYLAVLGGADCLVFTGGIGENSPIVREMCCMGLDRLGIEVDRDRNQKAVSKIREIQAEKAPVKILVVPTNEELEIAVQTARVLS